MEQWTLALAAFGALIYFTVFGLAGSYVAEQNGRSLLEGVCFGLVFGPLGLVIEACLPTQQRTATPPTPSQKR